MTSGGHLDEVLAAIDAANASDPNAADDEGCVEPASRMYGRRMSQVLADFVPDASEHLKIASGGSTSSGGSVREAIIQKGGPVTSNGAATPDAFTPSA